MIIENQNYKKLRYISGVPPLIYAHRGIWKNRGDQNKPRSFVQARKLGFGIEVDFRSYGEKLLISHDPILNKWRGLTLVSEFEFSDLAVAINIKEDGLGNQIHNFLKTYPNDHSFAFDGSIPEMLRIRNLGISHALRLSEFEQELPWKSNFVWVDSFNFDWFIDSLKVPEILENSFPIFVSPEIHGREFRYAWDYFNELTSSGNTNFGVCTDLPVELGAEIC